MKSNPKRHTLTAALPYTNGPIHIGHLAGVYVPADIYARYLRLLKKDVLFICGSDEHGVAISMRARKEGVSPQQIIDKYHSMIKKSFAEFGISFDYYGRTSDPIHHETASEFFSTLHRQGDFIEETNEQLYDTSENQFLADRFVIGTCPKCGHSEAYGDQCEKCGSSLNATDLIDPKSTLSRTTPSLKRTKHWFLPLDRYQLFLEDWILKHHADDWKPNVYGQVKSWLDDGLKPRAVTRDLDWGIPVPVEGGENKVLYVWFDAPIGYISATKAWAKENNKEWEPYWKDQNTELLHFIGKDNIVFHCVIFPAMLKAEGTYILPTNVPANEFLNLEGDKLSTSKNWAVWLHEYLEDFPNRQDELRYALTANAPETKDNDFTWTDFKARNDHELVAIFGNFIHRVMVLIHKYYQGSIPHPQGLEASDKEALKALLDCPQHISKSLKRFRFREASQSMMKLARVGNKYLADEEPWKLIKTNPKRVATIMHTTAQIAAGLAIVSEPFLPHTASKLRTMLGMKEKIFWNDIQKVILTSTHRINKPVLLFEKIDDAKIEAQLDKLKKTETITQAPIKEEINFDDFAKIDLRVGLITAAEKMKKADKLLILTVDLGHEKRTIISGIASSFSPDEVVGKQVTVVANLAPRRLRGVESQGMILMTEDTNGALCFVNPDAKNILNGKIIS